jgi:hypothetical protein
VATIHVSSRPIFSNFSIYEYSEVRGSVRIVPGKNGLFNPYPWLQRDETYNFEEFYYISYFLNCHLRCRPALSPSGITTFQVTFYEIVGPTNHDITKNEWKAGHLHSDQRQRWPDNMISRYLSSDYQHSPEIDFHKMKRQYKTATRYLRESAVSVSKKV